MMHVFNVFPDLGKKYLLSENNCKKKKSNVKMEYRFLTFEQHYVENMGW